MKRKNIIPLIALVLVLALTGGVLFAACNEGGTDTEKDELIFTDDLDVTDSENLAPKAAATASSSANSASSVLDGNTDTVWTAEGTSGEYLEITFSSPVSANTVVLREDGNFISGFSFVLPDENGGYPKDEYGNFINAFYRQQDRIERYRYCTFDRVELSSFRSRLMQLTQREREVIRMVAHGMSNKQVAENLGISEKTVQVHRGSAYRKLDLHNAAEIARLLLRSGDPL